MFRTAYLRAYITISFIALSLSTQAQKSIKWAPDGNSYYENAENKGIVEVRLPSLDRQTLVDAKQLTPQGKTSPLWIRNFYFSNDGKKVLIYTNTKKVWRYDTRGDYWVFDREANTLTQLGKDKTASSLMFAKFSPDGSKVAYVSKHNLFVEDLTTHTITPLTNNGTDRLINGTFDWVYEEEFDCRDGFKWSPDGQSIAFWQIDATNIKNYLMLNTTDSIYSKPIPVEYPKVGEDPSSCRIGVVQIKNKSTKWMPIPGDNIQNYLPRLDWAADGNLIIQQLNRKQNDCKLYSVNTTTGSAKIFYHETSQTWIDIESSWTTGYTSGLRWVDKEHFLWPSEKDGWRHIYLIDKNGSPEQLVTKGDFDIISINGIDKEKGIVYFSASPKNATQAYLYSVSYKSSNQPEPQKVTGNGFDGTHSYDISPNAKYATHTFSNITTPTTEEWVELPSNKTFGPEKHKQPKEESDNVSIIQVTTEDGVTLDGWMIKPIPFDSTKKYPVVFYVYSEPGATTVRDEYGHAGNFLYNGDMPRDGYIQISLDGRGTPSPKGAAWRKSIYKKVGVLNVHDQAMAARKILTWPYIDKNRVAVWGWSGGGSTTLNLMFQFSDIYQTGIAIAPVAYRLSYDNIYEERYMGLPQEDREAYMKASAITYAKGLQGNLLLVHGTGDDNVHYQNTEMLINELVKNNKLFDLMIYPNRTHSIREGAGTSAHLSNLYTRFLKLHCPGGAQ